MTAKHRLALLTLVALAIAAAVAITLAARAGSEDGPAAEVTEVSQGAKAADSGVLTPPARFKGAVRPPAPVRPFSLRDQDTRRVSLKALRGKVVVLAPMYTTCRDSCPLVAQQIRVALDDLERGDRADVVALALSVDPAHDTPASARRFLSRGRLGRALDFLLGAPRQLRPVWRAYGFAGQSETREHNSYVVLLDREGRQRVGFPVNYLTPEWLAHDLRLLVRESGKAS